VGLKTNYMKEQIIEILHSNKWTFEEPLPSVHFARIADEIIDAIKKVDAITDFEHNDY